jgi:hypothetical protein
MLMRVRLGWLAVVAAHSGYFERAGLVESSAAHGLAAP